MRRFLRKWYYRYVTYRVTIKYLENPNTHPSHNIVNSLEHIGLYVKNVVYKDGSKRTYEEYKAEINET